MQAFEQARNEIKSHAIFWNLGNPKDKVTFINKLVLDQTDLKKTIYSITDDTGNFSIHGKKLYNEDEVKLVEKDISSITLDDLIPLVRETDKNIFLKIDTEGCELDVVLGGRDFIEKFRPTIAMEMHSHMYHDQEKFDKVFGFLYSRGYRSKKGLFACYVDNESTLFDGNLTGKDMQDLHCQLLLLPDPDPFTFSRKQ
jgi:FkbM family methyltransferase